MTKSRDVYFYLHDTLRERAIAGNHNFLNKVTGVIENAGFTVKYAPDTLVERIRAETRPGYSMVLMDKPINERGLTFRLTYFYPFWHIERVHQRWRWPVAKARFDAKKCPITKVKPFTDFWREKHFGATAPRRDGFVLVALQGKLTRHRSFQYCSPIEMLEHVLKYDSNRQIIATLHPKETYKPEDHAALKELCNAHPRLKVDTGKADLYLPRCDYLVTQNSAVALSGYFMHKPSVLFGKIDFHHIAANVFELGPEAAIRQAPEMVPDFDAYLWWFLQRMSINAGRANASGKIQQVLQAHGWPM